MSKNYNFHQSLEDKCHRMLNAVEPGSVVAIHRRVAKDECFVVLRGKVRVTTHDGDGAVIGDVVFSWESGGYGVDVSGGVWCMVEALELGSILGRLLETMHVDYSAVSEPSASL